MKLFALLCIALLATACASAGVKATGAQCVILVSFCCLVAQVVYFFLGSFYYVFHAFWSRCSSAPAVDTQATEHRVVVLSMYAAGSAVYLALPALCMWDLNVSLAFLVVLTFTSMLDPPKYADFSSSNVDVASVVQRLRRIHVSLHLSALTAQVCLYFVAGVLPTPHGWVLVPFAMCSPLLLRALSALHPLHVLEMGLPVSSLWSIFVLCWYVRQEEELFSTEADLLGFLVVCPFSLAAVLGCILQGFRQNVGLMSVIGLTMTVAVRHGSASVPVVISQLVMLAHAGYWGYEHHRTGASFGAKKVYVVTEGEDVALV